MPGGVHLFLGLFLLFLIPEYYTDSKQRQTRIQWLKAGIVIGAILPDIDLPIVIATVSFTYLFLGYRSENVELAEAMHRSWTHSLPIWIPLLFLFALWYWMTEPEEAMPKKESSNVQQSQSTVDRIAFMLGLCLGVILHVLSDTSYMKGVRMFWPLYNEEIFFEIPYLFLYKHDSYSFFMQKFLVAYDHFSEVPFYLFLFWSRSVLINNGYMKDDRKYSMFINNGDYSGIWKAFIKGQFLQLTESEWIYLYKYVIIAQTTLVWIFWFFGSVVFYQMEFVHYFVFMYFPGTVFLLFSLSSPFIFQQTLRHWNWRVIMASIPFLSSFITDHAYIEEKLK
jgi:membrane-bound metal-dependent hydrolase YbcI (DUF457 family)